MQKARLSHLETPGHYIIVTDPPTPEQLLLKLKTLIEQHGRLWRTTEEDGNAARELREAEAKTLHDMDELEQQAHRHLEERRQDPDLTPKLEAATDHPTIRIKREEDVRRTRTRYPGGGTGSGPPQPTAEPRAPPSADEVQTAKHGFQTALLFSPPTDREDWALGIQQSERAAQLAKKGNSKECCTETRKTREATRRIPTTTSRQQKTSGPPIVADDKRGKGGRRGEDPQRNRGSLRRRFEGERGLLKPTSSVLPALRDLRAPYPIQLSRAGKNEWMERAQGSTTVR